MRLSTCILIAVLTYLAIGRQAMETPVTRAAVIDVVEVCQDIKSALSQ